MKIAVFGATGRTGLNLVEQALDQGFEIVALARTPAKLPFQQDAIKIIQGDVKDPVSVAAVIKGVDAVISVLGPTSNKASFEVSQGMENIIQSMRQFDLRRVIISAGAGVGDPEDKPGITNKLINLILKTMAKNVYADMLRTVAMVRESNLDWTVVRVPRLTDEPKIGRIKVGLVGITKGTHVSRADLAAYMLTQARTSDQIQKSPFITN